MNNTVLILSLQSLASYEPFGPWIDEATSKTQQRLLVFLVSPLFDSQSDLNPTGSWKSMEKLLSFIYTRSSQMAMKLDRVLMRVDVIFQGNDGNVLSGVERESTNDWDASFSPSHVNFDALPTWVRRIPRLELDNEQSAPTTVAHPHISNESPSRHPVVALGGTFDHLHAGHKILLSMAAWIADQKLIVGVTDDSLLTKKSNHHVLESLSGRMEGVREFLQLFRPQIEHDVLPISDVYGPTAADSNIQALVVSKETLSGAEAIDKVRRERSLPPLKTYVIDVIAGDSGRDLAEEEDAEALKAAKMSSTYIRQWIVQHRE